MTSPRPATGPARPLLTAALLLLALALAAPLLMQARTDHPAAPGALPATGTLPLTVQDVRVVAVPPGIQETSVFGTFTSTGPEDLQLSAVSSPAAARGMLMETHTHDGMTGMSRTRTLTVPAGGTLTLSNAGDHVMLTGLRGALRDGDRISLTFTDPGGRTLTFDAPVVKP
ncbi:copper chaperone PCu(A)C [Deinococcus taeanensis]|uniref:copper chaperone PCu(A)C n=1 Tax=Deinococcus taeanensis TaxID=2737050 RepID=UPI001CDD6D6F|nr:copper chaperone PCu(A)C [Deinococcus taeanensis]UBV43232.1 copper chaperone PCu(A)C [Deinococcus taeanensis]